MVQLEGKYTHIKSENIDEYFKATGVNYVLRKMMVASSPTLEIKKSESGEWTISLVVAAVTTSNTFKLGEAYEQSLLGNVLQCVTTLQDGKLVTECVDSKGSKTYRTYEATDEGITMRLKAEGVEAVRYFKRQ